MKQLLVTVGTTEFDDLIRALDCEAFVSYVQAQSFTDVVFQIGRGEYEPGSKCLGVPGRAQSAPGFGFSWFRFIPNLSKLVSDSHTVISHCGAGTILEVLESGAELVVAVNVSLMGNHQMELADALSKEGQCQVIYPATACAALMHMREGAAPGLRKSRDVDVYLFPQLVDEVCGFQGAD
jgi:beta-1,4-N-acetylglucosaminyltransferase